MNMLDAKKLRSPEDENNGLKRILVGEGSNNAALHPMQNAFIQSFNGRFRGKCLNKHFFAQTLRSIVNLDKLRNHLKL